MLELTLVFISEKYNRAFPKTLIAWYFLLVKNARLKKKEKR
jgi:hypothetical protein